jgi:ribosome recycling factor
MRNSKKLELSEDELKNAEVDIQEATDKFIALIDNKYQIKEKEIMTV